MHVPAYVSSLIPCPDRVWVLATALSITTVAGIVILVGPSPIMSPWDVFTFLDGGWRIFNGQVPGTDFHNPIGPLVYWLTAIGMKIAGPSLQAYVYGNLIFLAVVAPWAAFSFFRKLPPLLAFLMSVFIAVLITATHPLGYDPARTTYAMSYNRYGWALLSILCIQLLVPDRANASRPGAFDAFSAGLLLGLIFTCKISYFIFGVAALVLGGLLRADLRHWILLTPLGIAIVCFGAWATCGLNPVHYLSDIAVAGKSQSIDMRIAWLKGVLKANWLQYLILGTMWTGLVAVPFLSGRTTPVFALRTSVVFAFIIFAAITIAASNAPEHSEVPLFLVAGVYLLDASCRQFTPTEDSTTRIARWPSYIAYGGTVIVLFGNIFVRDVMSYARSYKERSYWASNVERSQRFESPQLYDFRIPHTSRWHTAYSRASDVPARINDGLTLLRRHVSSDARVLTLAFADPFSFAMGLHPPRGTPLWWDLGISFNRENYPPPDSVFSDVSFVIYPLLQPAAPGCCQETVLTMLELYGAFMEAHFVEVDRSLHWVLLERRQAGI